MESPAGLYTNINRPVNESNNIINIQQLDMSLKLSLKG